MEVKKYKNQENDGKVDATVNHLKKKFQSSKMVNGRIKK